jgi:hypothetical protein
VQLTIVGKVFVVPLVVLMMVVLVEDSLQSEERTKSQMIEDGITTNSDVPSTCIHVLYTGLHAGRGPGEGRELTMGKESSLQAESGLPWYSYSGNCYADPPSRATMIRRGGRARLGRAWLVSAE